MTTTASGGKEVELMRRRVIVLDKPIEGAVTKDSLRIEEQDLPKELKENELLLKVEYISVDPAMRIRTSNIVKTGEGTHMDTIRPGQPLTGPVVARVIKSASPEFKPGDLVGYANGEWSDYNIRPATRVRRILPGVDPEAALSVVGLNGLTAYFGLLNVGDLKAKETVVITAAAGATGYIAGVLAKLHGASTIVGIVGSDEKARLIRELGFDVAVNYKTSNLHRELKHALPHGIDVFFDNVGGKTGAIVRQHLRTHGRIVQCGSIALYNQRPAEGSQQREQQAEQAQEMPFEMQITHKRLTWQGFLVTDFHDKFDETLEKLAQLYRERKIPVKATVYTGLQAAPAALTDLFEGKNIGKMLVHV